MNSKKKNQLKKLVKIKMNNHYNYKKKEEEENCFHLKIKRKINISAFLSLILSIFCIIIVITEKFILINKSYYFRLNLYAFFLNLKKEN